MIERRQGRELNKTESRRRRRKGSVGLLGIGRKSSRQRKREEKTRKVSDSEETNRRLICEPSHDPTIKSMISIELISLCQSCQNELADHACHQWKIGAHQRIRPFSPLKAETYSVDSHPRCLFGDADAQYMFRRTAVDDQRKAEIYNATTCVDARSAFGQRDTGGWD